MGEERDSEIEVWKLSALRETEEEGAAADPFVASLRPDYFGEYIGQDAIKENLMIACQAAIFSSS